VRRGGTAVLRGVSRLRRPETAAPRLRPLAASSVSWLAPRRFSRGQ